MMKYVNVTYLPSTPDRSGFREIFRNRYVTSLSFQTLLRTVFRCFLGLTVFALFLACITYFSLLLFYLVFGMDPLQILTEEPPPSVGDLFGGLLVMLFLGASSGRLLGAVKHRLSSYLYVLARQPLASVEGRATFNFGESTCYGIEVGGRYFDLDKDCWLTEIDLEKLEQKGGEMRIWYVPTSGILVSAEWRPAW
jgi:hypothetical protein